MVLTLVRNSTDESTPGNATFEQFLNDQGLSANTVSAYLSDVRRYDVSPATTDAQHTQIAARIVRESSAASSRMRRLSALAKFFAHVNPQAGANPYLLVKRPSSGVVLPQTVATPDEARAMITYLRSLGTPAALRTATAVALMAGAGLRVGEVVALRFADLNPDGSSLRVADGKGNKTRDVPVSDLVREVLTAYVSTAYNTPPMNSALVVPVTVRTVQRDIAVAAKAVGDGRNLNPHAFRHGFATAVYRNTTDIQLTADLIGHASVATTSIYLHIADERRVAAVSAAL